MRPSPIEKVCVITTGHGSGHHEHVYGTKKPTLWWIFFGKRRITLPINVYVIEHPDGLVLFDTGVDTRVVTDPDYWPDPITALFMRHIFEWDIEPGDRLSRQLELAGYAASDVSKAVISHLHADHVGGIGDIPQADLFVAREAWEHMLGLLPGGRCAAARHSRTRRQVEPNRVRPYHRSSTEPFRRCVRPDG